MEVNSLPLVEEGVTIETDVDGIHHNTSSLPMSKVRRMMIWLDAVKIAVDYSFK